jgi:hypothetical protein
MATKPVCVCGCEHDDHAVAYEFGRWVRLGCRVHRACTKYRSADEERAEHERVLTAVAEVCTEHAVKARAELGEPIVVMPAGAVIPAGPVLAAYDAWACEGCGSRYWIAYTDHPCGPLTPVTVTITRREATTEEQE